MKETSQKVLVLVVVFSLGAAGGTWAQAFLLPYFASHSAFAEVGFVKDWSERVTVIREAQEVVIAQEQAFERVVQEARNIPVAVQSAGAAGARNGSGFIITSDGLIVTLAATVPQGNTVSVFVQDAADPLQAQVLKRDFQNNLALLKVEASNLPTAGFGEASSVRAGQEVALVGKVAEDGSVFLLVHQAGVRAVSEQAVRTNMFEKATLGGSPLFNIQGHIVGIATIEPGGRVVGILNTVLREFSGL